jgi:hypothetical protein
MPGGNRQIIEEFENDSNPIKGFLFSWRKRSPREKLSSRRWWG